MNRTRQGCNYGQNTFDEKERREVAICKMDAIMGSEKMWGGWNRYSRWSGNNKINKWNRNNQWNSDNNENVCNSIGIMELFEDSKVEELKENVENSVGLASIPINMLSESEEVILPDVESSVEMEPMGNVVDSNECVVENLFCGDIEERDVESGGIIDEYVQNETCVGENFSGESGMGNVIEINVPVPVVVNDDANSVNVVLDDEVGSNIDNGVVINEICPEEEVNTFVFVEGRGHMILNEDLTSDWMEKDEAEYSIDDWKSYAKIHKLLIPEVWDKQKFKVARKFNQFGACNDVEMIYDELFAGDNDIESMTRCEDVCIMD